MKHDQSRIDDSVLALLAVYSFDGGRAWKDYDFGVMDRLHAQGFIENPASKAKSVWLTQEGLARGQLLARRLFAGNEDRSS